MKRKGFFSRFGHSPVFRGAAVMLVALAWSSPAIGSQDTTNTPATPTDARTIFDAVKSGDLAKVRALLKSNPDLVNSKDTNDWTPLLLATIGRNEDVMELLIASNADVNATNNFGDTPLVSAVMGPGKGEKWTEAKKEAQIARVKLLLAHNVDLNSQEEALLWAVGRGDREIAELLLASRADVNGRDKHGETPLHEAARNWREDMVESLLARKADPNSKDNSGNTPLHEATAFGGQTNVAEVLLAHGAGVNETNNIGQTPLYQAVGWCNKGMVKLLLSYKADPNATDNAGSTPLHKAADIEVGDHKDAVDIMKLLLANNADVDARDNNGLTPLHWAAGNSKDLTELLLANKAEINAIDHDGWTPLTWAEYFSRDDVAKFLQAHGGRDFVHEIDGAARNGDLKKIKLLLASHPTLISSKDKYGKTPLHYAAENGRRDVAELLLTDKVEVNAKDYNNETPLHLAVVRGNKDVAGLLRQHGGHE